MSDDFRILSTAACNHCDWQTPLTYNQGELRFWMELHAEDCQAAPDGSDDDV